MGAVFLAKQISLNRQVALKVISDARGSYSKTLERFKREANILANISHPNIVPIYEVGQQGPYSYFAMEYVNGPSLANVITAIRNASPNEKTSAILSKCLKKRTEINTNASLKKTNTVEIDKEYIPTICKIIIDVASALDYAHSKNILHRDINLLDSTGKAKLVDFGLAKSESTQSVTVTGELFGTPNYMSPEQIRHPDKISRQSDIYSLGATFYECLTLHLPFEGSTITEILDKILSQEAKTPRKYCAKLSDDLSTILLHTLKKVPSERYNSAMEFSNDIKNALDLKPIIARKTGFAVRTYKTVRRNPIKISVGFVIFCLIILSIFLLYIKKRKDVEAQKTTYVSQLVENADVLLCQAALNTLHWPIIGRSPLIEKAIQYYDEVLLVDSRNCWALIQRGIASLVNGKNIESAMKDFEYAELINPDLQLIALLKSKAIGVLNVDKIKDFILKNHEILSSRDAYIPGMLVCQQPDFPERCLESLRLFEICLEKESDFYPAMLARIFAKSTLPGEKNLEECITVMKLKPNVAFGHLLSADLLRNYFGKLEEAIKENEKAVELQPWNPLCLLELGLAYEAIQDTNSAEKYYLKAQELDVSCFSDNGLANFYARQKNYKKALDICNEGISKKCDLFSGIMLREMKLLALKELGTPEQIQECLEDIITCLERVLLEVKNNTDLSRYIAKSKIEFTKNNFDDGINELNNALKIQPELPLILDELKKAHILKSEHAGNEQ